MKKILLALLASMITLAHADTSSMDITITDMKEAIYRLINDVGHLKRVSGATGKDKVATQADIMRIEKQQNDLMLRMQALEKSLNTKSAYGSSTRQQGKYDRQIKNYVESNLDILEK